MLCWIAPAKVESFRQFLSDHALARFLHNGPGQQNRRDGRTNFAAEVSFRDEDPLKNLLRFC